MTAETVQDNPSEKLDDRRPAYFGPREEDGGWLTNPPAPWRRYGARMLDVMVSGVAGFMILGFVWYSVAPLSAEAFFSLLDTPGGRLADVVMTVIMAGLLNSLMIGFTGYTIGKAIFGMQVLTTDRSLPGVGPALKREFLVWVRGLDLGIAFVSLITMITGYKKLQANGEASWDAGEFVVLYRPDGTAQTLLNVLGVALIIASRVLLRML